MKKLLIPAAAAVLALLMLVPGVPSVSGATEDVTGKVVILNGTVYDPLASVLVEIYSGDTLVGIPMTTGADGRFSIAVDMSLPSLRIVFSRAGMQPVVDEDLLTLLPDGSFAFTETNLGQILMVPSYRDLVGYVVNESGQPLSGVRVEFNGGGITITAAPTDGNGRYFIHGAPTGPGTLKFDRSDLRAVTVDILVMLSYTPTPQTVDDVVMKSDTPTYLFGLDLEHTLMAIALFAGLFVVVLATAYVVHLKRRHNEELERSEP